MKPQSIESKHRDWVATVRRLRKLREVGSVATHRHGLSPEDVRLALVTAGIDQLEVHEIQAGDTRGYTAVFPVGTERGPNVVAVRPLNDVLNARADAQDMWRATKLAAREAELAVPAAFDGDAVGEGAAARRQRLIRECVLEDAKVVRGVTDYGIPVPRPPTPDAKGRVSTEHQAAYFAEREEVAAVLDLEAARLKAFREHSIAEAIKRVPEYARANLQHVTSTLAPADAAAVEQAITDPASAQTTFLISRPILTADGKPSLGFGVTKFNAMAGGRPSPASLARSFGLPDESGVRVQSIAEVLADAKGRLEELAIYGEGVCSAFPHHNRGLFVAPDPE